MSTTQQRKFCTYDSELIIIQKCSIILALSKDEFSIICSKFPITVFIHHNPILVRFTRRGNLTPRQYKSQMLLTKFLNLRILHTAATNPSVADILSRSRDFSTITNKMC